MPVYTRHEEVQQLSTRQGKVNATHYNHVQTALKRINHQLRYNIPKLKHLDLILQKDAWIVVDKVLNDIPIVSWSNFQVEHRSSLHEPIQCEIRLYHYAATMILNRTIEAMELMLGEELAEQLPDEVSDVLPFKKS